MKNLMKIFIKANIKYYMIIKKGNFKKSRK